MEIFDINAVEQKIGYVFNDKMLLRQAFTHSSYAHEHNQKDNEVLEFFGDAIMQFVVTEYLCKNAKGDEGKLTQKRAQIVSRNPLICSVNQMGLTEYMLMGNGQKKTLRNDDKLISSVYEAIVAAIYIDGGLVPTKRFIKNTIIKDFEKVNKSACHQSVKAVVKSQFQEFVQANKLGDIEYRLIDKSGPDHLAEFTVYLYLNGKKLAEGKGNSKKSAEAQSAFVGLQKLEKRHNKSKKQAKNNR